MTTDNNRNIMISHSGFHQKIINKYQKGKRNFFRFPMMIFYKHTGHNVFRKITTNILLQFYFHNLNIELSFIVKNIQNMKRLFSWFRTEKFIPQFIPALLKSFSRVNKMFSLIQHETVSRFFQIAYKSVNSLSLIRSGQSAFSWPGNVSLTLTKIIRQLFPMVDAAFYSHPAYNNSVPDFTVSPQLFSYGNYVQIINPLIGRIRSTGLSGNIRPYLPARKDSVGDNHFILEHRSPAILSQVNLLQDTRSTKTFQNWTTINKPLLKYHHSNFGSDAVDSITPPRRTTFNSEHFYFRKQHKIDREVEEIRKIVVETKEAVTDKSQAPYPSMDVEIKKHLDINRLSDQVYQNIERRIRIERERRGL